MRLGKKRASSRTVICNPRSFGYQRRKNRDSCPNGYHRLLTVKASAVFVHLSSFSSVSAHSAGDTERSASSTEYAENRIGSGNVCKVRHGHMQEIGFVDAMQANVGEVVSADPSASHRIASHRIASHRIASHRIASHRIASHRSASIARGGRDSP